MQNMNAPSKISEEEAYNKGYLKGYNQALLDFKDKIMEYGHKGIIHFNRDILWQLLKGSIKNKIIKMQDDSMQCKPDIN